MDRRQPIAHTQGTTRGEQPVNVLVTGGAGYIGSVIVEELLHDGHRIVVLDNLSQGHQAAVLPPAELVVADLADRHRLTATLREHKIEAVVHMAASSLVAESMQQPLWYFRNNVIHSLNLVEAMIEAAVPLLVFSSSAGVYGEPAHMPITEDTPLGPVNVYGETKTSFERTLLWLASAHGLRHVSLRYFNAAGATHRLGEDHRPEAHLIPLVLQVALGKAHSVPIRGTAYPTADGTAIRDYVHVVDLARAHVRALQALAAGRSIAPAYNVGTGRGASVREVIAAARQVTGQPIPVVEYPPRPGDPALLIASAAKIQAELDWQPQLVELETIVGSAWEWHRQHPQGYG